MLNDVFKRGTEELRIQFYGEQIMSKADFEKMKSTLERKGWWYEEFEYNAFERINCKLFCYTEAKIFNHIRNSLLEIGVRCYLEEVKNETLKIVFCPFTVINSVHYDIIHKNCEILYQGTKFGKWLEEESEEYFEDTQNIDFLYCAFLCFLDILALRLFEDIFSKEHKGFKIETVPYRENEKNLKILNKIAQELLTKYSILDMQVRVEEIEDGGQVKVPVLSPINEIYNEKNCIKQYSQNGKSDTYWTNTYHNIYYYMLRKKRQHGENAFIAIEELLRMNENKFSGYVKEDRKHAISAALTVMLEQRVLVNDIKFQNGIIYCGFRCGENSDIKLPFFNKYIMHGISLFYKKCHDKSMFLNNVTSFLIELKELYGEDEITEREFLINNDYFKDIEADLGTLVENKLCYKWRDLDVEKLVKEYTDITWTLNVNFYGEQIISKEDFETMKFTYGEWAYEDCSYRDILSKRNRSREYPLVKFGYFYDRVNYYFNRKIKSLVLQIGVKCYYKEMEDGNFKIYFYPWNIMNSVSYDMICKNLEILYKKTEFGKWLKEQPKEFFEETQNTDFLYHAYLCFLDIYTLKLFLSRFSKELKEVEIKMAPSNIRGNFSEILDKTAHELLTKAGKIDMEIEMEKVKEDGKMVKVSGLPISIPESWITDYADSSIYHEIYHYMLKKKRIYNENAFIAVEEVKTILEKKFPEMYTEERQKELIKALAVMLERKVLVNDKKFENGIMYYGFRCGKNSDIILPFYNTYIFYGMSCLYKKYPDKDEFSSKVTKFSDELRRMLRKNEYIESLFNYAVIAVNEYYFKDEDADLDTLVKNKMFLLDRDRRVGGIEWEIDKIIEKI